MNRFSQKKTIIVLTISLVIVAILIGWLLSATNKDKISGDLEDNTSGIPQEQSLDKEQTHFTEKTDFRSVANGLEDKVGSGDAVYNNYTDLGVAYYNMNNLDGAEGAYEAAIKKEPEIAFAYSNLGNVLRDKGDYRGAETNYRKAIELDPNFINAYLNLAVMFFAYENNTPAAIAVLEQGKVNNPENDTIKTLLEEYKNNTL